MANKFFAMGLLMMRFTLIPSFIYQDDLEWKIHLRQGQLAAGNKESF